MEHINRPDPELLLTVMLNSKTVCTIARAQGEERPVVPLLSDQSVRQAPGPAPIAILIPAPTISHRVTRIFTRHGGVTG